MAAAITSVPGTAVDNGTLSKLRLVRSDYNAEREWHRFLMDAANGTGGFAGRFSPPALNLLGWAASAYGYTAQTGSGVVTTPGESYLDQFTRETDDRFQRRRSVAHYTNYVGPIHELLMSYVSEGEFHRQDEPDEVAEWRRDVDGNGTDWDTMRRDVIQPRASELGWMPVMFDMPEAPEPGVELSRESAAALGMKPRAIPLFPANLLDWIADDESGEMISAKVRIDSEYREDILELPGTEERYWVWTRTTVTRYSVRTPVSGPATVVMDGMRQHSFGCVPIVIFRGKPTPGDKVRGISNIGDLAIEARTHFNLNSELRDHIRGQVFAVLGIPMADTSKDVGTIVAGNHGAIKVPQDANIGLHYVAPPASVAETLENSRAVSVKEMHRIARVEYDEKGASAATSGVARAYQFEKTNKRLAAIASSFARSDQKALRLVGRMMNAPDADRTTVVAPTDFRVDDLTSDLENVLSAVGLGLGPTANAELKKRTYRKLAPNTPQRTLDQIDEEIDQAELQAEQDAALASEMHAAGSGQALDPSHASGNAQPNDQSAAGQRAA